MDQDIKQRLMEQVFSVLPVLPDDQQAYAAHHKAESEKRLVAQNRAAATAKTERDAKDKEAKDRERARPPLRPREPKRDNKADSAAGSVVDGVTVVNGDVSKLSVDQTGRNVGSGAAADGAQQVSEDDDSDVFDEEVTPERLVEIKAILFDVYSKYSQEKLNKIDRLLAKYVTHEEEFLRFVLNKYSVDPNMYKSQHKSKSNAASRASSPAPDGDETRQASGTPGAGEEAHSPGTEESGERPYTADGIAEGTEGEMEHQNVEEGNRDDAAMAAEGMDGLQIDTGTGPSGNLTARSSGPKTESGTVNRNQTREVIHVRYTVPMRMLVWSAATREVVR
jgi:hypothetical protein